ncbi:antibiotic biosynthesis monooxygenase [Shewanella corallii]|uniref:Antibiotic biosynthesis monooxygenase n=1 Tax=Shewanella corallii TaxID=560080 RepID=A0ABT0NCE5_9GAMM|nr:putative quinol monooxygenase [Shewanella corallii]MCL2915481.1 antibiotic biosynthesis monooxygenase [Shewanella corallii]
MKVLISGVIRISPHQREEALRQAYPYIQDALKEPGCIAYQWSADVNESDLIYVYEEWESQHHLQYHFSAPSYLSMLAHLGNYEITETRVYKYLCSQKQPVYDLDDRPTAYFSNGQ